MKLHNKNNFKFGRGFIGFPFLSPRVFIREIDINFIPPLGSSILERVLNETQNRGFNDQLTNTDPITDNEN